MRKGKPLMHQLRLRIAGWDARDVMVADPGIWHCGPIRDGVSLGFAGTPGGFVLAFADLERLYQAAKKVRVGKAHG